MEFIKPKYYIEGVQELAELLNLEPSNEGVCLAAKDGKVYSLTDIITKHIELMTKTIS